MDAICIANNAADILYFNRFAHDLTESIFREFLAAITSVALGDIYPHMVIQNMEYAYVFKDELFWCVCYKKKSHLSKYGPSLAISNLYEFHKNCSYFLGIISQHSVKSNFEVIHEIVLESMRSGIMQSQKPEKLKLNILTILKKPRETSYQRISSGLFGLEKSAIANAGQSISATSTESQEIYIDVVEKLSVTLDPKGKILYSEVNGTVTMSSHISHSPIIILELNSQMKTIKDIGYSAEIPFTKVNFSSNVDSSNLETDQKVEVVVIPGKTQLLEYSLSPTTASLLPFHLTCNLKQLTESDSCVELKLVNKTGMSSDIPIVKLKFSVPQKTSSIMTQSSGVSTQYSDYSVEDKLVTWTIRDFPGCSFAHADIRLVDSGTNVSIENAVLEFEISNWLISGLCIENMSLTNKEISIPKWVRYVSLSDSIIYRF